ncbi:polysaccharide pyruvyl transferase family protein [Enterococcus sp.]|uniref:polysaccharide pyruvyl transferase family protein n=1 Tax=Enterococcus sp. TaxID=35783 RepID=UPI002FC5E548
MKITINTIVDYNNYGNRLQNYALQEVLESLGHEVETLKNYTKIEKPLHKKLINSLKSGNLKSKIKNKLSKNIVDDSLDLQRITNFKKFTNKYIKETDNFVDQTSSDFSFLNSTDCFVIGSDQVWNCHFSRFSELDFALFSQKPKISYAASFGISNIPDEWQELYKKGLNQVDFISVRELAGKKIVEGITRKKATVVLDPTMLLSRKQWDSLTNNLARIEEPFILTYFLEDPLEVNSKYINEYANNKGLKVRQLGTRNDLEMWIADPAEFVNLFSQAEAIFTDSFHACVFAIIFEKYFEVFDRNTTMESMNSRIDTLLRDFNLETRWNRKSTNTLDSIDYIKINEVLKTRREESLYFLKEALKNIENEK